MFWRGSEGNQHVSWLFLTYIQETTKQLVSEEYAMWCGWFAAIFPLMRLRFLHKSYLKHEWDDKYGTVRLLLSVVSHARR